MRITDWITVRLKAVYQYGKDGVMARPGNNDRLRYKTTGEVAKELNLPYQTVLNWLKNETLPEPTIVTGVKTRLYDKSWLKEARKIRVMIRG